MVSLGLKDVYSRIDRSRDESIAGLFEFLSQPSISTLGVGIEEMSSLLAARLRQLGFRTRVIKGAGHPFVYGEQRARNGANSPTVLIYGHYDVQPVEPLDAWKSDPFKPAVRDGRIYARGAGDNKGQLYAQLMGIKALSDVRGGLPLNVKCIFEGEEENGSPNLEGFVKENKELLRADLVYTSDGPLHESGRPMLVFGVRGLLYVELTATGANRDLHSGNWGGPIPNPAWDLVRLLGTMKDERGRVRIEGFYERVRRPTPSERAAFRRIPLDKRSVGRSLGLKSSSLPDSEEFYRRLMAEPTLNICGIYGGYTGRGSKTVIPSSASVKMDMRLVPDQDPEDIFRKLARHVKKHGTGNIQIKKMSTSLPSRTSLDIRFAAPIAEAVRDATGMEPVIYPSLGATLPDYVFTRVLGVPSIIVPYANIDESNHAPNENIKVENFVMGMKCAAAVLESLSRVRST